MVCAGRGLSAGLAERARITGRKSPRRLTIRRAVIIHGGSFVGIVMVGGFDAGVKKKAMRRPIADEKFYVTVAERGAQKRKAGLNTWGAAARDIAFLNQYTI